MRHTEAIGNADDPARKTNSWFRVLGISVVLYLAALLALELTRNPNLFPTVVMIGNFMIPVTYVAFFYERRHLSQLTLPTLAQSFIYGGILGVLAASILEPLFIQRLDPLTAFQVGFIEEFAKILGVLVIARGIRHDSAMDGLIIGAAAGMGFAALESCGYAFTSFLRSGGSLTAAVHVTLLRGILSPLGHGTWTAILASVLFRESSPHKFHFNRRVIGAYVTVVLLHGLWDGLPWFLTVLREPNLDVFSAEIAIGVMGVYILMRRWREARQLQMENPAGPPIIVG